LKTTKVILLIGLIFLLLLVGCAGSNVWSPQPTQSGPYVGCGVEGVDDSSNTNPAYYERKL